MRRVFAPVAVLVLLSTALYGCATPETATPETSGVRGLGVDEDAWTVLEAETDNDLYDAESTANGQFAVGGNGVVLDRELVDGEVVWTKIVDGGPSGNGKNLYGADVTNGGEALWFVGSSGAVGEYAVAGGVLDDHSGPGDSGDNMNAVAVTGPIDKANVYAACDSGHVHYSFEDGESGTWNDVTPGSGSSLQAIDFHDERAGHVVDTNGKVFATDDGETWNAIGIPDANVNFYGVDSNEADDVWVAGGNGMVFHWDGAEWTRTDLGDANLKAIEIDNGQGYAVGNSGQVFRYDNGTWTAQNTPTGQNLKSIVRNNPTSAVGASGTVIER